MAAGGRSCVTAWRVPTAQTAQIVTVAKRGKPADEGRAGAIAGRWDEARSDMANLLSMRSEHILARQGMSLRS